jgi:hypothetical protein
LPPIEQNPRNQTATQWVAVQQRVAGADNADEAGDEAFVQGATAEADDEDSDGYWWWQSTEARAAKWVVPQWEWGVLAASRVGWEGGLTFKGGGSEREWG